MLKNGKKWKVHFIIEEFPWVWTTPSSKAQLHKNLCIVNKKELVEVEEFFALMSVQVFFSDLHFIGVDQISLACHCTGMQGGGGGGWCARIFFSEPNVLYLLCYALKRLDYQRSYFFFLL